MILLKERTYNLDLRTDKDFLNSTIKVRDVLKNEIMLLIRIKFQFQLSIAGYKLKLWHTFLQAMTSFDKDNLPPKSYEHLDSSNSACHSRTRF